jgi:hypothetical protein
LPPVLINSINRPVFIWKNRKVTDLSIIKAMDNTESSSIGHIKGPPELNISSKLIFI